MERRNLILLLILAILIVALGVVGTLVLRKRATDFGSVSPKNSAVQIPAGTTPIESYTPERPWQESDPVPVADDSIEGGLEETEAPQS